MSIISSSDLFRTVFERSPVGYLVYDKDFVVRECNDTLVSILRTEKKRIIGLDLRRVPDQRILPAVEKSLAGEESSYVGEYVTATSDTTVVAVFRCVPLREPDGTVSGGFGLLEDDTARVRAEREMREQLELVQRQAATIRALGTPILKVWDQVLCLPVIGIVDSMRAAEMTETMLRTIASDEARFAVIDLTGVEVVDTATAQHLMQLFRAASLVGTEAVLCGIRPAVAQTVTDLGVDIEKVRTKRTMYEALQYCLHQLGNRRGYS